jgi:putative hemolysin
MQERIFSLILMGILLVFSAFFSGTETALFSLTPDHTRRLRNSRRTQPLLTLLQKEPFGLLTAILFGNLIVNILFFCTGAAAAGRLGAAHGDWMEAAGGFLILVLIILFGEIVPKAVGINHPEKVLRLTAWSLWIWFRFILPFRRLIQWGLHLLRLQESSSPPPVYLTSGELKELLDAVRHEPGFGSQEKEILEDIVNLSSMRIREIMVPRVKVLRGSLDVNRGQLLEEARRQEYSRVLIYRENDDDLLGYVFIKDLFFDGGQTLSIEPFLHPLTFVPETKRADALLHELMDAGKEIVAVVDEYGGLAGIVTVEDLLSEVVGDFEPEPVEEIQKLDETTYRLQGQLPIRSWRELFTGFLPGQEVNGLAFDTLGGFIISLLGRMPRPGDTVAVRNLCLTIESIHHHHIGTVLLHLQSPEGEA